MGKKTNTLRAVAVVLVLGTLGWAGLVAALDAASATTVVEGRLPAVRACVSSSSADTHGGLTLTATLSAGGAVRQVDVTRRGPHITPEVARCAATAIRGATFEGADRGDVLDIRLLVSESGGTGERVRVRDVVVNGGISGASTGSGSGGSVGGGG